MKDKMSDIKKKALEALVEHLSMLDDPLEMDENSEKKEKPEAEVEVVSIEAEPEEDDKEELKKKLMKG